MKLQSLQQNIDHTNYLMVGSTYMTTKNPDNVTATTKTVTKMENWTFPIFYKCLSQRKNVFFKFQFV